MTKKVYTFGYSGKKPEQLERIASELDAVVFDVRYSPRSRNPLWNGKKLAALLGDRYRHVRALGNRNYRGGPVEIEDLAAGIQAIRSSKRPVILMCVCSDVERCHRTFIGEHLRTLGFEVRELSDLPVQLELF
ncbi:MAG: DUF488 domain-containing protein [Chloroflexia bacterium]|nr:DUF488 domain-containing protein [Chloroflexia bacterium]